MSKINWRALVGGILVAFGVLYLLQSLDIVRVNSLPWAVLLGGAGLTFLYVLVKDRTNWWAVIPGTVLLSIAVLLTLDSIAPRMADPFGGAIVLGGIALSFWVVYILDYRKWWAIIPAGVMTTLALVTITENYISGDGGAVFFFGLAATFGLLYILPTGGERMTWPWIPAAALLFVAAIISVATSSVLNYFWPLLLIAGGGYLIFRTLKR